MSTDTNPITHRYRMMNIKPCHDLNVDQKWFIQAKRNDGTPLPESVCVKFNTLEDAITHINRMKGT